MYDVVEIIAREALKRMVNAWGIERTEEKIIEICSTPSTQGLKEYHLALYNRIYKGK
jgi:hypothetical protein